MFHAYGVSEAPLMNVYSGSSKEGLQRAIRVSGSLRVGQRVRLRSAPALPERDRKALLLGGLSDNLAVEQPYDAFGIGLEARIVGHHADRRAAFVDVAQEVHDG